MQSGTGRHSLGTARILLAGILLAGIAAAGLFYASASRQALPPQLRIGVLPDQGPEMLRNRYAPLLDYLARQTGIETQLVIPTDYQHAVDLFRERRIDLAFFGGLTFVQSHAAYGAEALVMREIDTRFISWFVVRPELAQKSLSDLGGESLTFGDRLSTSGHLMPRYFLQRQWSIEPEKFFSEIGYSGAHDQTVYLVRDGRFAIGAVNAGIARQMFEDGRIGENELRVLWQTPPYPDYVWAVQPGLAEGLKTNLRDAFLQLDADNPGESAILDRLGTETFLPANPRDFETLSDIARGLGLIGSSDR